VRLFVALDLDDRAREAIAALQKQLMRAFEPDRALKRVDPAHMHLTLAFLGEIPDAKAVHIVDALSQDVDAAPFAAELRGLGVFPPHGAPRILWLGVGEGADQITDVQRKVASRLERHDVVLEKRPFHPHLTLARWRTSRPADRHRALSAGDNRVVADLDVQHVTPYQSRLSAAGPSYAALARATLT
jgi:RNA 2',3'-cyclic 3'-phosphodiesterase